MSKTANKKEVKSGKEQRESKEAIEARLSAIADGLAEKAKSTGMLISTDILDSIEDRHFSIEQIEALCDRDNWMKADEAIQLGFLDEIVERKA